MPVFYNMLKLSGLSDDRRVKNACLCLAKRLMLNMLRNTPCGARCLRRRLDRSGGRSGRGRGELNGTGRRSAQVRRTMGRIMKEVTRWGSSVTGYKVNQPTKSLT